ncbi:MAG: argininosuccinate lyase [Nitrososphaerota archaeon]
MPETSRGTPHRRGIMASEMDREALRYTSSLEFDREILDVAIYVNIAHIRELQELGLLEKEDADGAVRYLGELLSSPPEMGGEDEDVHVVIERRLSQHFPDAAAMLSLGKSRNDAVVACIKLKLREKLLRLYGQLLITAETMLRKSIEEAGTIFPIYTHLQRAMPATYGFILHSHALKLLKQTAQLRYAIDLCDESPLGSAAGAGTNVPLDRRRIAGMLGFRRISLNALEATSSRDFILHVLSTLLGIATAISSLAEEMVIQSSEEFGLLVMPDELSATSSIMPQKRNPVVPEVMRTKVGEVLGALASVASMLSRQPSGYNLDLQQVTPKVWKAVDEVMASLGILSKLVERVVVDVGRAYSSCEPPVAAVMLANHLTLSHGIPFRSAHAFAGRVSRLIGLGKLNADTLAEALRESGIYLSLSVGDVMELMNQRRAVESYLEIGSSNPSEVRRLAHLALGEIAIEREWVERTAAKHGDTLARLVK